MASTAAAAAAETVLQLSVPAGMSAGETMLVPLPGGHVVAFEIPGGLGAGEQFEAMLPSDVALLIDVNADGVITEEELNSWTAKRDDYLPVDGAFEVVFPNEGALGINMYAQRGQHLVEPVSGSSDNADAVDMLSPGDTLVAINGANVEGLDTVTEIIPQLKACGRPLTLTFRHAAQDGEFFPGLRGAGEKHRPSPPRTLLSGRSLTDCCSEAARAKAQFRSLDTSGDGQVRF